jgi:hypothetical protein
MVMDFMMQPLKRLVISWVTRAFTVAALGSSPFTSQLVKKASITRATRPTTAAGRLLMGFMAFS